MESNPKLHPEHLQRLAGVYVRQSHPKQVRENTASTELQYSLVDRAVALGWSRDRVVVFAGDLGHTATIPDDREEFGRLAADVGMRRVGLVLGFDVTRMARNNADWHKLFELCGICDTLIGDTDGLYHPGVYNDRLILGLKGIMSEAESHLRRKRMHGAIELRATKGELRKRLPVGLECDDDGRVRLAIDESVRRAIELVFKKFTQLGSAHQVYRFLQSESLLVPARRHDERQVRWEKPRYGAVLGILTNPRYAGAYVYGRCRRVRTVDETGRIRLRIEHLSREQWKMVLQDQHPGYVPWVTFVENQQRLSDNALVSADGEASRVVREGGGLLQGLVRCGVCGRRMSPVYPSKGDSVRYVCDRGARNHGGESVCQSVGGSRLHRAIVEEFLDALSPASMQVTIAALEQMDEDEDAALEQLRARHEQAQYEADRARRQYDAVEPENRLVARTLEAEWNRRLAALAEVDRQIEERRHQKPPPLTTEERQRVLELGLDLRRIWDAPTTTPQERKQLLRAVLDDVVVRVDRASARAAVTLVCQGGATMEMDVRLRRSGETSRVDESSVIENVRKMAASMTDMQIAGTLARRAIRTPTGLPYNAARVLGLRKRHGIPEYEPTPSDANEPTYTAEQAAEKLGVSHITVLRWLREGFLVGEQVAPSAPWRIKLGEKVRMNVADKAPAGWLAPKEAAKILGMSRREVLQRVQNGALQAVMAGKGRRSGLRINITDASVNAQQMLL
jgi:DNA invertase Pin-like site-specific DNA recombinase/transposase